MKEETVNRRDVILPCMGLLLLMFLSGASSPAQGVKGEIKNVEINGDEVAITYDLKGLPDDDYVIEVFLVPVKRPDAARELAVLRGDVGRGKFSGAGRKIFWTMSELPDIREGESYVFRINVDRPGIPWYYWAGGGAVVAGGAAAILLSGNNQGGGGGTPTPTPATNPLPPGR